MPIITLLNRVKHNLEHAPHPVFSQDVSMRNCYLTGLAMQAHSDGELVIEEQNHFMEMARLFDVLPEVAQVILDKATHPDETVVNEIRSSLIHSKHKYYFILDLQIMAQQDFEVKHVETEVINRFGEILEIDKEDRNFLIELANAVVCDDPIAKDAWCDHFLKRPSLGSSTGPKDFIHYTG